MGKKNKILLDQLKTKFIEGCKKNGHKTEIVNKIWTDWESLLHMHLINRIPPVTLS